MKTFSAKTGEFVRRWYVVDAQDAVLGRLATRIATVLRGKHKPVYTPHTDVGDFVVVINAEKIKLTGGKLDKKLYRRHSEYPGGLTEIPYRRLLETHPERAIERAVWGMLPHTRLGKRQMRKLKVYAGTEHPHGSQKPETLAVEGAIPVSVERTVRRERPAPRKDARGPKAKPADTDVEAAPKAKRSSARKPSAGAKKGSTGKPSAKKAGAGAKAKAKAPAKAAARRSTKKKEG